MEPTKEIGLDKVHLIALTWFQNHVRNDFLRAFVLEYFEQVLKEEYCYPIEEKFGQGILTKWLKKMVFWTIFVWFPCGGCPHPNSVKQRIH